MRPAAPLCQRFRLRAASAAIACLGLLGTAVAPAAPAPAAAAAPVPAPAAATVEAGARQVRYSFESLAPAEALNLQGTDASTQIAFGMRLDERVSRARLLLQYTLSPALLPQTSHLKIFLNDELLTTLPVTKDRAGTLQTAQIDLDPIYFVDFNRLRFQLIGHYTDQCEFPFHSSLWARLSAQSRIEIDLRQLKLKDNLALLPAPFFDVRDKAGMVLPVVLPPNSPNDVLKAAGIVASWFGVLADYRGVRFPVSVDGLPKSGNAVVFAPANALPAGLELPQAPAKPGIAVIANPNDPAGKLLVISGRSGADLQQAAAALALGRAALSGDSVTVDKLELPARRAAYDAPAWVDTRKPARFGTLVADPSALQVQGGYLGQIDTPLRLPPDLYVAAGEGVPVNLKYRYAPPADGLGASLTLSVNDQYVDGLPLHAPGNSVLKGLVPAKLLGDGTVQDTGSLVIPAFMLSGTNDLRWRFNVPVADSGKCTTVQRAGMLAAIDPDSTLDFSGIPHYTAMPNLALYANSGFPFTKYADLAETTVVLPDVPQPADIEAMLVALARMGSMTGLTATRFEVQPAREAPKLEGRDLLVVSSGNGIDALSAWKRDLPIAMSEARKTFAPLNRLRTRAYDWWHDQSEQVSPQAQGQAVLDGGGALGALMGFRSPVDGSRSVVALTGSNAQGLGSVLDALNDPGRLRAIRGDLALTRGDVVESFRIESQYFVGSLPWWRWMWLQSSRHPVVLALAGLLAGLCVAMMLFVALRAYADRRLQRAARPSSHG